MDLKLACGDNILESGVDNTNNQSEGTHVSGDDNTLKEGERNKSQIESIHENHDLQERIANCRKIIESLKLELTEEKAKLKEESKTSEVLLPSDKYESSSSIDKPTCASNMLSSNEYVSDIFTPSDSNYLYSSSVDTKLRCDDNLMEYEKQLQRYQETLTMAQTEKKNAIRKQMLAKVYKLKLMEVENQCNIELLRVKQSLECLEPLKTIVNKWKISEDNSSCDLNTYELLPRYPELSPLSTNDANIFTDDEKCEIIAPNEDSQV